MAPRVRIQVITLRRLAPARRDRLLQEIRNVAAACFGAPPAYQITGGDPVALDRAVVALARSPEGRLMGFTSGLDLRVPGVGALLHLGLTCVHPAARGLGLTHRLLSALVVRRVITGGWRRGLWCSNVASVLSSLGNVALHFEDVHPSPLSSGRASEGHRVVARALASEHRGLLNLPDSAPFDEGRFVFVGGNRGTSFAHASDDARYHHRDPLLNAWYAGLADLDGGDAVLQVSRVSLGGLLRYASRDLALKLPGIRRWVPRRWPRPTLPAPSGVAS